MITKIKETRLGGSCDHAAREIEKRKDELIYEIEKKLKQSITERELFTIRWKIV
jgi:hypothetical protein